MRLLLALLLLLAAPFHPLAGQYHYQRQELRIPMRDGVSLYAVALVPQEGKAPLPILLVRTPFSAANGVSGDQVPGPYRELAEDGYLFVFQDIRGRFASGGTFVSLRAPQDPRSPAGVNESTDTWDSIDWLVKHLPGHNGRVGVIGTSYGGWLAALAGVNPHPAVRAISPQAPIGDAWMGDDFFHQGAFRQTQGAIYSAAIEANPTGFAEVVDPGEDQYAFYLGFPTLDSLARTMGGTQLPTWSAAREHPTYDAYWQERALPRVLRTASVPTLWVGGFWDAEDLLGPQLMYRLLESNDRAGNNRIVLGPWSHNRWMQPGGDSLGPIPLGSRTADYFRREIQRPWFAHYLHGQGPAPTPEAWVFETGANAWRALDQWPPRQVNSRKLYLHPDGTLTFDAPREKGRHGAFTSDPANPVPFAPRPITDAGWRDWMLNDQRFLRDRRDVLTWRSAPLAEDLVIAGDVVAHLVASTSGTDADWVVKLMDQYPDSMPGVLAGYELMVNADILRGRYWKGFSAATPIPAGKPTTFTVDLHQQLYRFRKGHRIVVQVQGSWFPLYDRNPQTFVPNIFHAPASAYRVQEQRVWYGESYLVVPVP